MELKKSFKELDLKISELMNQPYFRYYLNTLPNQKILIESIDIILEEIRTTLKENDLYIFNHYEVLVENYYSSLNFYEEQIEHSSIFITQELLKFMRVKSFSDEPLYTALFNINTNLENVISEVPSDIELNISISDDVDFNIDYQNLNNEDKLILLHDIFNNLKILKEQYCKENSNSKLEKFFLLLSYQIQETEIYDDKAISRNYDEIFENMKSIEKIFLDLGYLNNDEEVTKVPSKIVNKEGTFDLVKEFEKLEYKERKEK